MPAEWPDVDVVMPVRNEEAHLTAAVESILAQPYAGVIRVYLGVGPSEDRTHEVACDLAVR